jgi:group I intron endonuclease
MFIIYALRDSETGDIRYIGKSVKGIVRPKEHWRRRYEPKYSTIHVYRWLRKCTNPPLIEVLEECQTKAELSIREQVWIAVYSATGRLTNMTKGGEGTIGRRHSEETRRKLSLAKKGKPGHSRGKKMSEEQKAKLRNKVVTEEARKAYSLAQKRRMQRPEEREKLLKGLADVRQKRMKRVRCSDGRLFNSIREAARMTGIASSNIIAVLKGRYRQAKGLVFEYV